MVLSIALWSFTAGADSFELKPQVEVDSQGILLDQIVNGKNVERLFNILLAPAPAWGETRIFKKVELTQLLAKVAPSIATNEFVGAPEVRISRLSRKLEEKELTKMLLLKLQPKGGAEKNGVLELRLTGWKPVPIPVDPIEVRILSQPGSGLVGNSMVRFEIMSGEDLIGTYSAFLKARLLKEVWVARTAIKRGATLDVADLEKEERDVINSREPAWVGRTGDPSCRAAENIPAGGIVYARSVQQRPVVQRGQRVQAVATDGLLSVSVQAETLEEGMPDQIIRARNLKTRKEIRGKVINEDTIQILF